MFRLGRRAFFIATLMFSLSLFVRAEVALPNQPTFGLSTPMQNINSAPMWVTPPTGIDMPDDPGLSRGTLPPGSNWEPPSGAESETEDAAIGESLGKITQNLDGIEAAPFSGESEEAMLGPEVKEEDQSECADQQELEDESDTGNVAPRKCTTFNGGTDVATAPTVWKVAGGDQTDTFSYFRASSTQLYQAGQDPWLSQLKQADATGFLVLGLMPSHNLSLANAALSDPFGNFRQWSPSLTMADDADFGEGQEQAGTDQVFQVWMKWKQTRALPYGWSSQSSLK